MWVNFALLDPDPHHRLCTLLCVTEFCHRSCKATSFDLYSPVLKRECRYYYSTVVVGKSKLIVPVPYPYPIKIPIALSIKVPVPKYLTVLDRDVARTVPTVKYWNKTIVSCFVMIQNDTPFEEVICANAHN